MGYFSRLFSKEDPIKSAELTTVFLRIFTCRQCVTVRITTKAAIQKTAHRKQCDTQGSRMKTFNKLLNGSE